MSRLAAQPASHKDTRTRMAQEKSSREAGIMMMSKWDVHADWRVKTQDSRALFPHVAVA